MVGDQEYINGNYCERGVYFSSALHPVFCAPSKGGWSLSDPGLSVNIQRVS